MKNEKQYLSYEEAAALLPNEENIHTFINNAFGLVGADWSKDEIISLLKNPDTVIELTGESARGMGHGIAAYKKGAKYQKDIIFIQTDEEKLTAFDKRKPPNN